MDQLSINANGIGNREITYLEAFHPRYPKHRVSDKAAETTFGQKYDENRCEE